MTTTDKKNATLGQRCREARRYAALTQQALATLVGISQAAIHKLEADHFKSSRKTKAIAMACKVDPVWLESGEGEMVSTSATPPKSKPASRKHAMASRLTGMERLVNQSITALNEIKNEIKGLQSNQNEDRKGKRQEKPV